MDSPKLTTSIDRLTAVISDLNESLASKLREMSADDEAYSRLARRREYKTGDSRPVGTTTKKSA